MKRRLALLAISALLAGVPAWLAVGLAAAQAPSLDTPAVRRALESIEPAALGAHMRFLADDLLEGRGTGTRGYYIAARYVAASLERLGLEPAGVGRSYFQPVPFRRAEVVASSCGVTLTRRGRGAELVLERDFMMGGDTYRPEADVVAEVVFVGYGVTAPELGYDDFAGVNPRGKIVAVLSGAPPTFPHTLRAHYSNGRVKDANLGAHGAAGVLSIRTPLDEQRTTWERLVRQSKLPSMRWLDPRGVPDGIEPRLQCSATLNRSGAQALFEGAPRTLEQVFKTAEQGKPQAFELPVRARLRRVSRQREVSSPNVVALLRGSDPRLRDQVVVYTAHLDHLGISVPVKGDSINNGAFDNATGSAALIEVAAAFAHAGLRPRRSILFLALTGEEKGLQGSSYFASHPTVPADKIVADLNMDMYVMVGKLTDLVGYGAEHSSLGEVASRAARRLGLELVPDPQPEEVIFVRSDQYSFVRIGVPSLFLVGGSGPEGRAARRAWLRTTYHSPQDDLKQPLDLESLAQFARANYLVGHIVANETARPAWKKGDFFGDRFGWGGAR